MKVYKRTVYVLAIFLLMVILAACKPNTQEAYEFTNPELPRDLHFDGSEMDDAIVLDGHLDEAFYQHIEPIVFAKGDDADQIMSVKPYFAEHGLLVGIIRQDQAIYYNSDVPFHQNDSVELYINPTGQSVILNEQFVQLRVNVKNERQSWVGVPALGYTWSRLYVQFDSAVHVDGTIIEEVSQDIDENKNANGYSVEIFIPWASLGLEETPESIDLLPAFVDSFGLSASNYNWNIFGHFDHARPADYITVTNKGYENYEGSFFGHSAFGAEKTSGFDVTNDTEHVIQSGGSDQWAFVKNLYASRYGFSVDIEIGEILNNDQTPKIGVIIGQNNERNVVFLLDPFVDFDNFYGVFVPRDKFDGTWLDWQWGPGDPLPAGFDYHEQINITIIRDEHLAYVFVNDVLTVVREHGLVGNSQPGLFTMNMSGTYINYEILNDAQINARIDAIDEPITSNDVLDSKGLIGFDYEAATEYAIQQTLGGERHAYFKVVNHSTYMVSSIISIQSILNNDAFPKSGIIVAEDSQRKIVFLLDPLPNLTQTVGVILTYDKATQAYHWGSPIELPATIDYTEGVHVTAVRDGNRIVVVVDNVIVLDQTFTIEASSESGFMTMNTVATFTNYQASTQTAEVQSFLDDLFVENDYYENSTIGFDVSSNDGNAIQSGGHDQWTFFKAINATRYGFSINLSIGEILNQDDYPKVGLIFGQNDARLVTFLLDPLPNFSNYEGILVPRDRIGDIWQDWQWGPGDALPDGTDYYDVINIKIVRDDELAYIFVNDQLVLVREHGLIGDSQPGLFTMNMTAEYFNFMIFDETEIDGWIDFAQNQSNENQILTDATSGFDLSSDSEAVQSLGGAQYAYFRDVNQTTYMVQATITIGSVYNLDDHPKIGLVAGKGSEGETILVFDPKPTRDVKDVLVVNKFGNNDWAWSQQHIVWLDKLDLDDLIDVTIIRNEHMFYYFIGDTLIYQIDSIFAGSSIPGLVTFNHGGMFSNLYASTDVAEIELFLADYIFVNKYNWSGHGNFIIDENQIQLGQPPYETYEGSQVLLHDTWVLSGDFFIEFDVSILSYAAMDWVWPKLSLLLIDENDHRNYFAIGTNPTKQNRFETHVEDWLNWNDLGSINWQDTHTVRIERRIIDEVSQFSIFFNGEVVLQGSETFITSDYIGAYTVGLTSDFTVGIISSLNSGSLS